MKKTILLLACFLSYAILGSVYAQDPEAPVRPGLFVSVIQDPPVLSDRTEILKLIDFAKRAGIRTTGKRLR